MKSIDTIRSDIRSFVASLLLDGGADRSPLDLETASNCLFWWRHDGVEIPEGLTAEILMLEWNAAIHRPSAYPVESTARRLTDYVVRSEPVSLYDQYRTCYDHDGPEVLPVDFLSCSKGCDSFPFETASPLDVLSLIRIGQNSVNTFDPDKEYCWFDPETNTLRSTDSPFSDGIISVTAFANYLLSPDGTEALAELKSWMTEDEIRSIFED